LASFSFRHFGFDASAAAALAIIFGRKGRLPGRHLLALPPNRGEVVNARYASIFTAAVHSAPLISGEQVNALSRYGQV
jgi:hypothetical protein